jgi:ABC-2 type transport system ATP-binding protein
VVVPVQSEASNPSTAPAAVEFRHVSKVYKQFWRGAITAVNDVSLRIEPGEVFALVGPNRAGKTTLAKMLLSLCRPTGGDVVRLGRPVGDRRTLAEVGYVHENHAFPRYLGAAELLAYYGALSLVPYEVLRQRVGPLLERVGLADRSREPIARFSKGMVQRLGIAQALINEPRLLVLDEPAEGLDVEGRQLLRGVMVEVRQRGGSVLLISHVLHEVEQVCDRLGVLVGGRLIHVGTLESLTKPVGKPARSLESALQALYAGRD